MAHECYPKHNHHQQQQQQQNHPKILDKYPDNDSLSISTHTKETLCGVVSF